MTRTVTASQIGTVTPTGADRLASVASFPSASGVVGDGSGRGSRPCRPVCVAPEPLSLSLSLVFTGVAFFTVGPNPRHGTSVVSQRGEMFVVGMVAATVVFVAGTLLKGLV